MVCVCLCAKSVIEHCAHCAVAYMLYIILLLQVSDLYSKKISNEAVRNVFCLNSTFYTCIIRFHIKAYPTLLMAHLIFLTIVAPIMQPDHSVDIMNKALQLLPTCYLFFCSFECFRNAVAFFKISLKTDQLLKTFFFQSAVLLEQVKVGAKKKRLSQLEFSWTPIKIV